MRQAGIIAAGALYALEHHRFRLVEDHANAKTLAQGLSKIRGIVLDPQTVETNIVIFQLTDLPSQSLLEQLKAAQILALATGPSSIRMVTNLMVSAEDILVVIAQIQTILKA